MAILQTPLLSFGARGHLAKTITYRHSKRQDVASAYTIPTDPRSPRQITQRNLIERAGTFWGRYMPDTLTRDAWRRYGANTSRRGTPYALFAAETIERPLTPETGFACSIYSFTYLTIRIVIKGINTGALTTEGNTLHVYAGIDPSKLSYADDGYNLGAYVQFNPVPMPAFPFFFQVRHSTGYIMSGIYRRSKFASW